MRAQVRCSSTESIARPAESGGVPVTSSKPEPRRTSGFVAQIAVVNRNPLSEAALGHVSLQEGEALRLSFDADGAHRRHLPSEQQEHRAQPAAEVEQRRRRWHRLPSEIRSRDIVRREAMALLALPHAHVRREPIMCERTEVGVVVRDRLGHVSKLRQ
jgi:hypothetical protein